MTKKELRIASIVVIASLIFSLLICDFALFTLARFPTVSKKLGNWGTRLGRDVYWSTLRTVIQYEPSMSQWDKTTLYRLKPGRFQFSNFEFDTSYLVNAKGFRDDEESLSAPEIIVLGDSYAMGWGVNQDETFANRIEKATGKRVLNTAISSFAIAREVAVLKEVDTSKLKTVLIQYCPNDAELASNYVKNNFSFGDRSEGRYLSNQNDYFKQKRYLPGILTFRTVRDKIRSFLKPATQGRNANDEAKNFLSILLNELGPKFDNVQIIVVELYLANELDNAFGTALKSEIAKNENPNYIKKIKVLDVSEVLDREADFFTIDEHINSEGHRKVADLILKNL